MAEDGGVWKTISGRRVFIKDGQALSDAMKEGGKFAKYNPDNDIQDFGTDYREYSGKPDEAIEHLLKEQSGHVPSAIYKEDIGDIDFVWGKGGKDGFGLAHIIERRNALGVDGEKFVRDIPSIIKNGDILRGKHQDRVYIADNKNTAVIRLDYDGKATKWLVTAYIKE